MSDDDLPDSDVPVSPGDALYSEEGELVGRVTGYTEEGVAVTIEEDPDEGEGVDLEERPGRERGEGYLMWRCGECGEMGDVEDGMPETCPNCGAPKEQLFSAKED